MTLDLQRAEGPFRGALACVTGAAYAALAEGGSVFLHPREIDYFYRLAFGRRRNSYLLGRYAAKQALGALLDEPDGSRFEVTAGIFGQPVVRGAAGVTVSISHADDVACAVAVPEEHPVAIDVETVGQDRIATIAGTLTAAEAAMGVALFTDEAVRHAVLWTAKEAMSKVIRCGMMTPFEVFETEDLAAGEGGLGSVAALLPGGCVHGQYRNFGQYRFQSWAGERHAMTLALPRRTTLRCGPPVRTWLDSGGR